MERAAARSALTITATDGRTTLAVRATANTSLARSMSQRAAASESQDGPAEPL